MLTLERLQYITDMIKRKKSVKVTELSKILFVSEATIRRDLNKLEKQGMLKRSYGGAILMEGLDSEIPISVREIEQKDKKNIIGQLAASLISDNNILIMDSSSTVLSMIPYLKGKLNLTVITNGSKTAIDTSELSHIKVYSTGGLLRKNSLSYIGEIARNSIESFYVDILFFSCRAISMEKGLSDIDRDEAELRRLMINNCREAVLLCDSTKFDKISFCKIVDFDKINYIVTDKMVSPQWYKFLDSKGVKLICL